MFEAAEHINITLNQPAIFNQVGEHIYWELAEEDTDYPFITFTVQGERPVTKEGMRDYEVKVRVFAKSLTASATIGKVITDTLKDTTTWKDRGMRSSYTDNEAKEAFIELTYNFKL